MYFNPRPREEGDWSALRLLFSLAYFNPRPRKEGDHSGKHGCNDFFDISIHALVKRATEALKKLTVKINISIHALVKRATSDLPRLASGDAISIHALVKRATYPDTIGEALKSDFNPRPRKEGD